MDASARKDLALIRRLMEETRQDVVDRGKHFSLWGVLTAVGLLGTWWVALGRLAVAPGLLWLGLLVAGWCGSLYVGWSENRAARVRTTGRGLLAAVWVTAAVTLTAVGLAGLFGEALEVRSLPGVLSAVLAIPVYLTSRLTGEWWLGWVAAGWWLGGAVMLFVPGLYTLPLMAGMALVLMAVPGAVLNVRAKGRRAGTAAGGA